MEPARVELAEAIDRTLVNLPICPVYQNATAERTTDTGVIKVNLIAQLTAPVRWTQTIRNMVNDGATHFTEVGPGSVLQGLIQKIAGTVTVAGA